MLLFTTQIDNAEDREFMLEIYERYKGLMFSIAKEYVSDRSEAEDLVQDSLVKLIKKCSTLKGLSENAMTAYIAYTVKNTAINHLKKQKRRNSRMKLGEIDESDYAYSAPSPEELLLLAERADEFNSHFALLSENDRLLLVSKYILNLNDDELAQTFDCKPDSIRMKLTRARRRAIRLLMEGELFSGQT